MKLFKLNKWQPWLIGLIGCTLTVLLIVLEEEEQIPIAFDKPMSVKTITAEKSDYQIQVPASGFIKPREVIEIRPEVSGKVTFVAEKLYAGADVKKGDILFSLDDRNYRNARLEAVAIKNKAEQSLDIEMGKQLIARSGWELLGKSTLKKNRNQSLALREPQLKERKADVEIAAARLAQAELDFERTRIKAPCNGIIISENIAVGKLFDGEDPGVKIGCTDSYHISVFYSPEYSITAGSQKVIINSGRNRFEGKVKSVIPRINPETRQKQALVEFCGKDVIINSYVKILLPGTLYKNIVALPLETLRSDNTVWIINEKDKLEVRPVSVIARDRQHVVIDSGIKESERAIQTHIASPLSGMELSVMTQQHKIVQNIIHNGDSDK
ncbi:MAG: efflux RND transporter periplasmic adaptor subunit [Desulfobacterales bacterium]|nr:efflux RND transporter periplasmic adaptor subunit [Desulfobacterales bacterium]